MNIIFQFLQGRQPYLPLIDLIDSNYCHWLHRYTAELIQMSAWLSQDIGLGREQGITSICRDFDVRVTFEEVQ